MVEIEPKYEDGICLDGHTKERIAKFLSNFLLSDLDNDTEHEIKIGIRNILSLEHYDVRMIKVIFMNDVITIMINLRGEKQIKINIIPGNYNE